MFMRNNRAKNGAPQPEQTAKSDASSQGANRKLSSNFPLDGNPDDWRFTPSMSSCDAINSAHYEGGLASSGPYGTTYEEKIPFVGMPSDKGAGTLAPEP